MQSTNRVFLVRPASFNYNTETALSNSFQNKIELPPSKVSKKAIEEFDGVAAKLTSKGVDVNVFDDTALPIKPDAIFPNNWISLHTNGTMVLYPMCTPNRRLERRQDIIESLRKKFKVTSTIDLTGYEKENRFLEGTGSVVFDHENKIAYACLSPRTDKKLFIELCQRLSYKPIYFSSLDQKGKEIYHTNVMMCIGDKFAVICLDSISDLTERKSVIESFAKTSHELIDISYEQMNRFAGNMLMLKTNSNSSILAMSESAYESLNNDQRKRIEKYGELVPLSIPTIETIGGGSARCMIAEIFLPPL
ncbi:MAG: amidinotransferase [Bacteroidetes bacterium]|nr:amidinotransferase [Bacteroidota bacterium]